jgi:hypothetical protein
MSEEQHNEETEVEAHGPSGVGTKFSASDEPRDEAEDSEVEGHIGPGTKASHPTKNS